MRHQPPLPRSAQLKRYSDEYADFSAQYRDLQAELEAQVLEIAATYCPVMEAIGETLAHLDVVAALAHVSVNAAIPYVRPTVLAADAGVIDFEAARHPCLEAQDDISFIANDVRLSRGDGPSFGIITGPNMGGKSTYIRQTGVVVLMAQIGCFVPCASARVSVVDCILVRLAGPAVCCVFVVDHGSVCALAATSGGNLLFSLITDLDVTDAHPHGV